MKAPLFGMKTGKFDVTAELQEEIANHPLDMTGN